MRTNTDAARLRRLLERGHARDLGDVEAMVRGGLVEPQRLRELFAEIEPRLDRYPAIDADAFRAKVDEAVARLEGLAGSGP